jgi:hypothetical protein
MSSCYAGFGPVRAGLQLASTFTAAHETSFFRASIVSAYSREEKGHRNENFRPLDLSRLPPILILLALVSERPGGYLHRKVECFCGSTLPCLLLAMASPMGGVRKKDSERNKGV